LVRNLLGDPDGSVRAQAAWSLGALGDSSDVPRLLAVAHAAESDAAPDAVAAIGRIAARLKAAEATTALCGLTADPRPYVRANAFAGLALAGHRCEGDPGRVALANDPSEEVRAAAALQLARSQAPEDLKALEQCARVDASGFVAGRCRAHAFTPPLAGHSHATLVYVVPEGAEVPRPGAPCAVLLADGLLRTATTDRRGAVFDPAAPEGEISLRRASAIAR
jgi:hypothetical protein